MKILHNGLLSRLFSNSLPTSSPSTPLQCLSALHLSDEMPLRDLDPRRLNRHHSSAARSPDPAHTLLLFQKLRASGAPLDSHSLPPVLSASSTSPSLIRQLHSLIAKSGLLSSPIISTSLLCIYSKTSSVVDALSVFDEMPSRDVVAWNALLSSLVTRGLAREAVSAFRSMAAAGVLPTGFTLCSLLKACAELRSARPGRQIHARVVITGCDSVVVSTALIDLYSSCSHVEMAIVVFSRLECPKDPAIHNAVANACVTNGCFHEVFALLVKMKPLNVVFLTSSIAACSESPNLSYGRQIHCVVFRHGFDLDTILSNAIINMYSKCGRLRSARLAFDCIVHKNVISWTTVIDAYGIHGRGGEALALFNRMVEEKARTNVSPNAVTLLSILSACGHSGLVHEAKQCFLLMKEKHGLEPNSAHYACLIDLLGRGGRIEEAWDLFCALNASKNKLSGPVCVAMLNACRIAGDFDRGEVVVMNLLELDPGNASFYVQISNFYGDFGRWEGVEKLREVLVNRGLKKEQGRSLIAA